ncbi:MAG: S-layer homology domain-containing protein [Oscillospiraceae bacterium]|jgi:hypothetical protein|nr:S-layer homology domain-containing protein [Oscillospiraceae bacterium]
MNKLKSAVTILLAIAVLLSANISAFAAEDKTFDFAVTANGKPSVTVFTGSELEVTVTVAERGADTMNVFAVENAVAFSGEFFELVRDSVTAGAGVQCAVTPMSGAWDGWFSVSASALAARFEGDMWSSPAALVTFRLRPIKPGAATLITREHTVSRADGLGEYASHAGDAAVTIRAFPYGDVAPHAWFRKAVEYVTSETLIDGSASQFEPDAPMTRAALATALYRLAGSPTEAPADFTDVPKGTELHGAVSWAARVGVTNGVGGGKFDPEGEITREQLVTMLFRYMKPAPPFGDLAKFDDAERVSDWAREAMRWAVGAKVVNGKSASELDPQGVATRAEVSQILYNFT